MDAYNIKKILPRLLIAVIFIQFSYYIVAFMVDVTNVLGNGLGDLVTQPIQNSALQLDFSGASGPLLGIGIAGLAIGTVAAAVTGALFVILIPFLFAILGVFFTLVFRQVLIILLVILAPIAFVAWVLPGTEKFFKMWLDFLIKALMMYPLIVLLFASGSIVAVIASNIGQDIQLGGSSGIGNEAGDILGNILAIAALIVPLALVPATFKFAGTAVAGIAGGIASLSGRAQGGADGKGGINAWARRRQGEYKTRAGQGGTRLSKVAGVGGLVRYANQPYLGSRGARGQEVRTAAAIDERSKELTSGKYSIDQLTAMAYGSKDNMRAEQSRLRSFGTDEGRKSADRLEKYLTGESAGVWDDIKGSSNPIDSAAAAVTLGGIGFADEGMTRAVGGRFSSKFGGRVAEDVKGKSIQNGVKSANAWGIDDAVERATTLVSPASKMSREDISSIKDWDDFGVVGGAFDTIHSSGGTEATALEANMRQALHPLSGTSSQRQGQITAWLTRNSISTEPIEPPASPVNIQQVGGEDVTSGPGGTPSVPTQPG